MSDFEWDEAKSEATRKVRGFGFDYAIRIFDGYTFETDDLRFPYGERRIRATGVVEERMFTVVYTLRGELRRIISARIASRKERDAYHTIYG